MDHKVVAKLFASEIKKVGNVIWQRKEDLYYLTNRHFAVRVHYTDQDFQKYVVPVLTPIFGPKAPENDQVYVYQHGHAALGNDYPSVYDAVYKNADERFTGEATDFTIDTDFARSKQARLFKFEGFISAVDTQYVAMIGKDFKDKTAVAGGKMKPLYFDKGNICILPFRVDTTIPIFEATEDNVYSVV